MIWRRDGIHLPAALGLCAAVLALPGTAGGEVLVRVGGTGTAIGVMARLGQAFEKENPGHRLVLPPSVGSKGAVQAVASGALDVGVGGRALKPEEMASGVQATAFARTPFVFASGPRAGAIDLNAGELARILRGETTTWPGGERIRLILRPAADADTLFIRAIAPEVAAALDAALVRSGVLVAGTNQECEEAIAKTPGSLGPTTLLQMRTENRLLAKQSWNGAEPSLDNLASGAYPLAKTLYLLTLPSAGPGARRFIGFLGSAEARRILREAGSEPVPFAPPG